MPSLMWQTHILVFLLFLVNFDNVLLKFTITNVVAGYCDELELKRILTRGK